jgi:hypothetical protein
MFKRHIPDLRQVRKIVGKTKNRDQFSNKFTNSVDYDVSDQTTVAHDSKYFNHRNVDTTGKIIICSTSITVNNLKNTIFHAVYQVVDRFLVNIHPSLSALLQCFSVCFRHKFVSQGFPGDSRSCLSRESKQAT